MATSGRAPRSATNGGREARRSILEPAVGSWTAERLVSRAWLWHGAGRGNPGRAALALGVRVGLPTAGVLIAGDDDETALAAGLAGITGALLIDWLLIAEDDEPLRPSSLVPSAERLMLGLAGYF
jgi:hypothetical protein